MSAGPVGMALSGGALSVAVPALVLATRDRLPWARVTLPAGVAGPGFLVLHALVVLAMGLRHPGPAAGWLLEAVLLAGGVLFWLPVLAHSRHRLGGAGRCLYLFLAAPSLDLPAVVLIAHGHSWGGLAMIIAMLPLGAAALLATWRWITAEERVEVARTA